MMISGDRHTVPRSLAYWLNRYPTDALARGMSPRTVTARLSYLNRFLDWCSPRAVTVPTDITMPVLEHYQRALYHYRAANSGKPLSVATQRNHLTAVKVFCRYLTQQRALAANPAAELIMPKLHKRVPRAILTVDEVNTLCEQTNLYGEEGCKDRAIIEVFYATGIRRQELANLDLYDIDLDQGSLMVRQGKGKKDRLLPIGERACHWVDKYTQQTRHKLIVPGQDEQALFLDTQGKRYRPHQLSDKIKRYLEKAGIDKPGACHLFRHTMATLMLENGADLRFIQAMLGHADISTTTVYTQVSIRALKEVYSRTHPGNYPVG